MTKPITGTAVLMLQDEGKLNVADPVVKYLPKFARLEWCVADGWALALRRPRVIVRQ